MLLNSSGVSIVFLTDIDHIFVIVIFCGIRTESDKCRILSFLVVDKQSITTIARRQNMQICLSLRCINKSVN